MKTLCFFLCILFTGNIFAQNFTFTNPNFTLTTVGDGWVQALGATYSSDGQNLFVWEKSGKLKVCKKNGGVYQLQSTLVLDLTAEVLNADDNGLMGFALDPNFVTNGYIYLLYVVDRRFLFSDNSIPADQRHVATIGRVTRYTTTMSGSDLVADPASRHILLGESAMTGIAILGETHGLGSLVFAADGTLLVTAGDAAHFENEDNGSEPATAYAQALADGIIRPEENVGTFRAQLLNSHNGKLLRIDPATGNGIPSNPFYDPAQPREPKSRVWALGLRNPFRFTIKPGSGSTNPATGDIGEIFIGDVGYEAWEDFNICTAPGQNFGWPIYEGLEVCTRFSAKAASTMNLDEPNPLAGAGCSRAYYTFGELLKNATADGSMTVYNPCNLTLPIGTGPRYVHRRPALDFKHNQNVARVGIFNGNTADVATIGTPESGVLGTPFGGYCSIGALWYTGDRFPIEYQNKFFLADWASGFIKNVTIEFTDVITRIDNFATGMDEILCMAQNPVDGTVVVVAGWPHIMILDYGGNQVPVAKPEADVTYGPSPLTVNFTGSNSYDPSPGGSIESYAWNFGGGVPATSNVANPTNIVFTEASGNPKKFVAKLTVTDNEGGVHTDSVIISVNNTPPLVNITSPVKNSTYTPGAGDATYNCIATVIDNEHGPGQLKYEWQTSLRHNTHEHAGPIDNNANTTTGISLIGCNGTDTYHWYISLKVTDEAGLSTTDFVELYPDCAVAPDVAPPVIATVLPADGTVDIEANTTVAAIFDEAIDPATVNETTVQLKDQDNNIIDAAIVVTSNEIIVTPAEPLAPSTLYTVTLEGGAPGIEDLSGNSLAADFTWSFTTASGTLPVLLHKFSVTQESGVNLVKWTTDMEEDMEYFELERSINGINFLPINRQAAVNGAGATEYSFADNTFSPGRNYYRLKMVEHGAIVQYSIIISTSTGGEQNALKLMPNPVKGDFYVSYYATEADNLSINIKDVSGRVIATRKENVNKGQNIIQIQSLPNWVTGVYFLSVQDRNGTQQLRFVKSE